MVLFYSAFNLKLNNRSNFTLKEELLYEIFNSAELTVKNTNAFK